MKRRLLVPLIALLCAVSSFGQIQLDYLYARAVKDAKNVGVTFDSVLIETNVKQGVAITMLTMVMTPDAYYGTEYVIVDTLWVNGRPSYVTKPVTRTGVLLDSIELSMSLQLPTDFVASNMYLWVNGVRQTAYIQDRALASQQYNQIVGTRKDPALLQFWGNGNYDFRVFPAQSNTSRKIAIEFEHTFDDDSLDLITAYLPLRYDSLRVHYNTFNGKSIKYLKATLSSDDQKIYTFNMKGLGQGTFSALKPLTLTAEKVSLLDVGVIASSDPSGSSEEFGWVGRDLLDKKVNIGFAATLSESTVTRDPEPEIRIIALDVRNEFWNWKEYNLLQSKAQGYTYNPYYDNSQPVNVWLRAQKFAVLCLQNYVSQNQKFNVVIGGQINKTVFDNPVAPTQDNLFKAYSAILTAKPSQTSSTLNVLKTACTEATSKGVVVLISDLYQPYDYYITSNNVWTQTTGGKLYDTLLSAITVAVKQSGVTFFTIADEYRLSNIAPQTGGFSIGSLRWDYNYYKYVQDASGRWTYVPAGLPALFGMYNRYGIQITKVSSPDVTDIVYTADGYQGYWGWWGWRVGVMDDVVMAKTTSLGKLALPSYNNSSSLLRVAGKTALSLKQSYDFTVTGKLGGLNFVKKFTVAASSFSVSSVADNTQWAFRKAENLASIDLAANSFAVKKIGKDYHIVTQQTSLLALEPGMTLWADTVGQNSSQNGRTATDAAAPSASIVAEKTGTYGSGTVSLDSVSIDDLIAMKMPVVNRQSQKVKNDFAILTSSGSSLTLAIPSGASSGVTLSLLDLKGRVMQSCVVTKAQIAHGQFTWNIKGLRTANGYYTLQVRSGSILKLFKVPVVGR